MTTTDLVFYALAAAVVLAGAVVCLVGYRRDRAQRAAADARLARRMRQAAEDRARFAGGQR